MKDLNGFYKALEKAEAKNNGSFSVFRADATESGVHCRHSENYRP